MPRTVWLALGTWPGAAMRDASQDPLLGHQQGRGAASEDLGYRGAGTSSPCTVPAPVMATGSAEGLHFRAAPSLAENDLRTKHCCGAVLVGRVNRVKVCREHP